MYDGVAEYACYLRMPVNFHPDSFLISISGCSKSSICEAPVKSGSEERVVLFMYVASAATMTTKQMDFFSSLLRVFFQTFLCPALSDVATPRLRQTPSRP